jgi:wyosine [tRNA(Phe)-imidazoG37] synthetase (radical SAM superfamily)
MGKNILSLQAGIVYGPVNSRRLGRSLGLNVLPADRKICSFDCLYCQYGYTRISPDVIRDPGIFPGREVIRETVRDTLKKINPKPAYLTFSGNGEATLHPEFPDLVDDLIRIRDKYSAASKTAILSNSTMIGEYKIREAVNRLDMKIMKLDAGTDEMLQIYNRPIFGISVTKIVENLKNIPAVIIQSLFTEGDSGNTGAEHVKSWLERINEIQPEKVQIYTLDRGYPSRSIAPASKKVLMKIKSSLDALNIPCTVY